MQESMVAASYIIAMILFILSLGGLASQERAKQGNVFGILGMLLAIIATVWGLDSPLTPYILIALIIGSVVGGYVALKVEMTAMPQLIAILHSFVGFAAILVGFSSYIESPTYFAELERSLHEWEIFIGVFIGSITFTGSVIAYGKLEGRISSKPILLARRHWINAGILLMIIWLGTLFVGESFHLGIWILLAMTLLSSFLGGHLVLAIGGADMPVVVSMLNSYSGWAAAATGFMLENDLLIVTGALVGSSGAILSYIMCRAMNRSFLSVILGGFGQLKTKVQGSREDTSSQAVQSVSAEKVAELLKNTKKVLIVPGYGMAVSQAQHPVKELTDFLRKNNCHVVFGIHPVAGRLPGHMNVLLAESNIPYDIVLEMDEINENFQDIDLVFVIGANDIVNPSAITDTESPIYGMPVLKVWEAKSVVVIKRGMSPGYSGIDNPLFYKTNSYMLFGDAKKSIQKILKSYLE